MGIRLSGVGPIVKGTTTKPLGLRVNEKLLDHINYGKVSKQQIKDLIQGCGKSRKI